MNIDKQITVLVISFFALCIIAAILTANSKAVVSAIEKAKDQTPMQKLLDNIQVAAALKTKQTFHPLPLMEE
jgi:hypothetical protein